MNGNPFIFGRPVTGENFCNREEEIETAIGFLKNLQSFSIVGERRTGKTSFLIHILSEEILKEHRIDPEKYIIVHINMGGLYEITKEGFIAAIVERIEKQAQIDLESENVFDKLKAYAEKLASNGKNLVIALDEFEAIKPILDENFSHWLRFIFQSQNVMAITASQTTVGNLKKTEDMISPLFNIFGNLFLRVFSRIETENMIKKMFQRGKMQLKRKEISFLTDLSGGNPYLVQLVGHYYYEEKKKNKEIAPEKFQDSMLHQAKNQFEGYWNHLVEDERECLLHSESRDDVICYNLEKKGYLIKENGEWKVFSKLFERFLHMKKEEMGIKEKKEKYPFTTLMAISAIVISIVLSISIFMDFILKPIPNAFIAIIIIIIIIFALVIPLLYLLKNVLKHHLKSWLKYLLRRGLK